MRKIIILIALVMLGGAFAITFLNKKLLSTTPPTANVSIDRGEPGPQVLSQNLQIPWAIDFLPPRDASRGEAGGPNANLLVTERVGTFKEISTDGNIVHSLAVDGVASRGEGGLMGVAVHPNYARNNYVYLMYTYNDGAIKNKIVRYRYKNGQLSMDKIIIDNIPGNSNHNGGRLKFGPDGFLYATTGDAQNTASSQDRNSLAGKILRFTDDGANAPGNPFDSPVYSYGHRNPEGLAWDNEGRLWATEHGSSAKDEVNLIEPGKNYGWPDVTGDQTREGVESPKVHSGNATWAPGDIAFVGGKFYFAGLRGQSLFYFDKENPKQVGQLINGEFGRLREIAVGPDGKIYITTSNRDGRGIAKEGDDKILTISNF